MNSARFNASDPICILLRILTRKALVTYPVGLISMQQVCRDLRQLITHTALFHQIGSQTQKTQKTNKQ